MVCATDRVFENYDICLFCIGDLRRRIITCIYLKIMILIHSNYSVTSFTKLSASFKIEYCFISQTIIPCGFGPHVNQGGKSIPSLLMRWRSRLSWSSGKELDCRQLTRGFEPWPMSGTPVITYRSCPDDLVSPVQPNTCAQRWPK